MAEGGKWAAAVVGNKPSGRGRGLPLGEATERQQLRQPMLHHQQQNQQMNSCHLLNSNSTTTTTTTTKTTVDTEPGPSEECIQQSSSSSSSSSHPQSTSSTSSGPASTSTSTCVNDTAYARQQQQQQQQVPPQQKTFQLRPEAEEFVPRVKTCDSLPMRQSPSKDEISEAADRVGSLLSVLALNPGQFDCYAPAILELVSDYSYNTESMKSVTDVIFEKSVSDPNLRYNGARLCNYLSENLVSDTSDKIFRQLLLSRCEQEFENREAILNDTNKRTWLHGLVHFIGELFIHLQVMGNDGNARKCEILSLGLCQFLDLLLSHPNDDNLKCVGQVLKFTGAALEDEFHNKTDQCFDKLLAKIKDIVNNNNNLSRIIKDMLLKIVDLRSINWGRSTSSPISKEEPFMGDFHCGEPVLYGPDGQPISTEESRFLESNQYLYEADDYEDYADYGQGEIWSTEDDQIDDDQMDDEIAAAYEQFLAEQGNSGKIPDQKV